MTEEELKYRQAVARQQWENGPCRVVRIELLPDRYRLTRRDGQKVDVTLEFGREQRWLALCVRETTISNEAGRPEGGI